MPPPRAPPSSVARVTAPRPKRAVASSSAPSTRRHSSSSSHSVSPASGGGTQLLGANPDQSDRKGSIDSVEQLEGCFTDPLADRRRLGHRLRAADRREIGEAHLDRDRACLPAVRAQACADAIGEPAELRAQHRAVVDVGEERLFMTDALLDARRVDTARIESAGEMPDPIAHRGAERTIQDGSRGVEDVGDDVDAACLECLGGLGSDPPQRADRTRPQERVGVCLGHDQQSVRLADRRGHLGHVLGRGDADAAGQPGLVEHSPAQGPRDLTRTPPQPARASHIEERLVDRERFDKRCHVMEDAHDLGGERHISLEVRRHGDRRRTQAQRLSDVHRRADAEPARFVRRARNDAASFEAAHDDRLALQ